MDSPPHPVGVGVSGGSAPRSCAAKTACCSISVGPARPLSGIAKAQQRAEGRSPALPRLVIVWLQGLGLPAPPPPASCRSLLRLSLTLSPGAHFSTWASSETSATLVVVVRLERCPAETCPLGPSVPGRVLSGSRSLVTDSYCPSPLRVFSKHCPGVLVKSPQDLRFWLKMHSVAVSSH